MAYCTVNDVEIAAGGASKLRELADYDRDSNADPEAITAAISAADSWIDGELAKRLSVPLDPVPELVKNISMDEAVFVLKRRRSATTEADREDHAERLKMLMSIKTGTSTVGEDPQPTKSSQVVDRQLGRPSDKATSRDAMKGFW